MKILRKLKCKLLGHDYRVHQSFTPYSRRVLCDCCGGDWAMNDDVRVLLPWDSSCEAMYRAVGYEIRPVKKMREGVTQ